MSTYTTPEDIANRALQHCGARRIASFSDVSKNARETAFVYDKIRRAELRRTIWKFAIRRSIIRPITPISRRFTPSVWAPPPTTYNTGFIVQYNGTNWISFIDDNGSQPGADGAWQAYFGSLIVDIFQSNTPYYIGDLVWNGQADTPAVYVAVSNELEAFPAGWMGLGTSVVPAKIPYPITLDTVDLGATRTVYPLPQNFLRQAPILTHTGSNPFYGTTGGVRYNDLDSEGTFMTQAGVHGAQMIRFIADVPDVTRMDELFCEAFAARIAEEVVTTLTQSKDRLVAIRAAYNETMDLARQINRIELGSTEVPEEEYSPVRDPLKPAPQVQQLQPARQ